jgi:hypothetical protein
VSIDRTKELFARAVATMAMDEGPLRVRRAAIGSILLHGDSELPNGLRPAFRRLGSIIASAQHERGLTIDLTPLSDDDVRRAARLIVELNGHLNTTWQLSEDQSLARAVQDRRRANLVG